MAISRSRGATIQVPAVAQGGRLTLRQIQRAVETALRGQTFEADARQKTLLAYATNVFINCPFDTEYESCSIRSPSQSLTVDTPCALPSRQKMPAPQREKRCLVLEAERYRYQKYLSDIAGQDIRQHGNDPTRAVGAVRD